MKNKTTILLIGESPSPLLVKMLCQNTGTTIAACANYQEFLRARKRKKARLIVGSFADKKSNFHVNDYCLKKHITWLPFRHFPTEHVLDIGPVIGDKKSACYACYERRLTENLTPGFKKKNNTFALPKGSPLELVAAMHIANISKSVLEGRLLPHLHKTILFTFQLSTGQLAQNTLLQHPLCPACETKAPEKRITIQPRKIVYAENGLRTVSQEKTWDRIRRHIHHAGILTGILQVKKPVHKLATFQAISADPIGNNRFRSHSGKGITDTQNKISGSVEAIERYCAKLALLDPFEKITETTRRKLGRMAVPPSRFQMNTQNRDDFKKINWIPAWSLTRNRLLYVPYEYVALIPFGSNGLASGNCMEEAILHGIFEIIERDVYMIADLQEMVMPDLNMKSVSDRRVLYILKQLELSGLSYHIKYFENDFGIPMFGMHIFGKAPKGTGYAHAVCAHLNREIALTRTVTEAVQQFPKYKTGARWLEKNTGHYTAEGRSVSVQDIPTFSRRNLKTYINHVLKRLDKLGFEVLAVNHSLPGLEFAAVRVLIPGLQPIWFRESPHIVERVFSLPLKLGYPVKAKPDLNYGRYSGFPYYK